MKQILLAVLACLHIAAGRVALLDTAAAGLQNLGSIAPQSIGVVTVISSPGTPSALIRDEPENTSDAVLSMDTSNLSTILLYCRGSTLGGTSQDERTSLALCSLVSGALIVDGVTTGDVQAGLQNSRHARTLTALFRSRIKLVEDKSATKQLLIIGMVDSADTENDTALVATIVKDIKALYKASAVEKKGAPSFEDAYDLKVISVASSGQAKAVSQMPFSVSLKACVCLTTYIILCLRLSPWRRKLLNYIKYRKNL
jgi:hypothetical protein